VDSYSLPAESKRFCNIMFATFQTFEIHSEWRLFWKTVINIFLQIVLNIFVFMLCVICSQ